MEHEDLPEKQLDSLELHDQQIFDQSLIAHSWTASPEKKQKLQVEGQLWKQGVWSKEETELLKQNIFDFCYKYSISDPCQIIFESGKEKRKNFYKTIAKGINRPLFSIYRRVVRMYDTKNHVGKYSAEELKKLVELRKEHGNDWQKIGLAMGRSAASIKDRCRHLKVECNSGPWTVEEEDLLSDAVYAVTRSLPGDDSISGIPWIQIAQRVGIRSERQCRKKWISYCNVKSITSTEWNSEDEIYLIRRLAECQVNNDKDVPWADFTQTWPRSSIRSQQWLRAKWRRLKSSIKDCDCLSLKEICDLLLARGSSTKVRMLDIMGSETYHFNATTRPGNVLNVIGIIPSAPVICHQGVNFSIVGQPPIIVPPSYVTKIPMYVCSTSTTQTSGSVTPGVVRQDIKYVNNVPLDREGRNDNIAVVQLDLDGGDESAVTTDVMFSGSSLCSQGSPLGFVDKGDLESEHSHGSK